MTFTPFKLLFGEEAMTPEEATLQSLRVTEVTSTEVEATSKDLLEENKMAAVEHLDRYQKETEAWRNKRIKIRSFEVGQLVLWRRQNENSLGKVERKWEGPFIVIANNRPGSYHLTTPDGEEDPHSWNTDHLIRYFP
ncbi:unnamed protein product [Urochloa humidicola]